MTEKVEKAVETKTKLEVESVEELSEYKSPSQWYFVALRLKKSNASMLSLYYVIFNILLAMFYPIIIPFNPVRPLAGYESELGGGRSAEPNLRYVLGTTTIGRDVFSGLLAGAETSILVGFIATIMSMSIGVVIGLVAGFYGGVTEEIFMRITDMFLSLPGLLIALTLIYVIKNSDSEFWRQLPPVLIIIFVLGVFGWAGTARLVTATVKQTTEMDYVKAARVLGAGRGRIMFVHILPNVLAPIIVVATLAVSGNILSEAGLTFLGIGDISKTISWGVMVSRAQQSGEFLQHPLLVFLPGFSIFFIVLAINILGDGLRDALDPRLKD